MTLNFSQWVSRCRAVLEGNQKQFEGFRYTRPAPHVYEYQWLWDSCFHAITYRWFDLKMAQAELLSVVARQVTAGPDAGLIPHMNYWRPDGEPLWGVAERSIITQPPLVAVAAERVFEKSGDLDFLAKIYPSIAAYHDWLDRRRDLTGEQLVTIIHPWETGCDASPRWDGPLGLDKPTPEQSKAARHQLVEELRHNNCDAQKQSRNGSFTAKPLDLNGIRAADARALGRLAVVLGRTADAAAWEEKWAQIRAAMMAKMVHPDGFFDLAGENDDPIREESTAQFMLLFGECVDRATAARLVDRLQSSGFSTPYVVSTTPTDSPRFDPTSYWRGNVWLSVNWLIVEGLKKYGYTAEAQAIQKNSLELVEQHGFYEYFNPLTGQGYGPDQQSWSTIVLDFAADLAKNEPD